MLHTNSLLEELPDHSLTDGTGVDVANPQSPPITVNISSGPEKSKKLIILETQCNRRDFLLVSGFEEERGTTG